VSSDRRTAVLDTVVDLFVAVDEGDWPRARAAFTDTVRFDMSSMTGEPESEVPADDIVAGWTDGLAHLDAIHHQVSNFRVELADRRATVRCYGIAYHYRAAAEGGKTRTFVGTYTIGLVHGDGRWRTEALRFDLKFIDGNAEL
jgi:hypothetical protein